MPVAQPIPFYVDEHIPALEIRRILRDHIVEFPISEPRIRPSSKRPNKPARSS
jgi:hypothetical protein